MNTALVSSFVLISILRGQPRTPPSGENLGVLDYHLNFRSILNSTLIVLKNVLCILPYRLYIFVSTNIRVELWVRITRHYKIRNYRPNDV